MSSTGRGEKSGGARDLYTTPLWSIRLLAYTILRLGKHTDKKFDHVIDIGANDGRVGMIVKNHIEQRCDYDDQLLPLTMIDIVKPEKMLLENTFIDTSLDRYFEADFLVNRTQKKIERRLKSLSTGLLFDEKLLFVSNPPFSISLEIISNVVTWLEAYGKGSEAWFMLPLNWLGTLKRSEFLHEHPPYRICSLAPRPCFTGDGKTDSNEYCWMQWRQKDTAPPRKFLEVLIGPTKRKKKS